MALVESSTTWLRQSFAFSNSADAWRERLAGLGFLLVATLLVYLTAAQLAVWQSLVLWSIYGIALAFCSRQGWIKLFGPVLFYDMVRTSRRARYSLIRIAYGGFLFIVLSYMALILWIRPQLGQGEFTVREAAQMAETFFGTFMIVQLTLVVLLTPAYVAGAIAEEKDRQTLEFMLATDLHNREIVLSKFISRIANLTLLLLTGLPILSILQLIGGVDAELVLAGFAGVGLTMLGIASISILLSTLFKKPRDAISLTYLFLITYGTLGIFGLIMAGHPILNLPLWFGENPPTIRDVVLVLDAGNPISAVIKVVAAINGRNFGGGRTNLAAELPGILTRYAWFHLVLSIVCITWSILRVRAIALKQTSAGKTAAVRWWEHLRPRVGNFPMLWKEFFIDGRTKVNWLVWLAVMVLVLLTLGTGLWVLGDHLWNDLGGGGRLRPWRRLGEEMNVWFRFAGTSVACLTLLMLAVRAATSITSERERDTFDALVTTPMSAEGMLFAKIFGNITSMRPAWLWFASLIVLAVFTGGLHPFAVPFLLFAWVIYAIFVTMLGLAFSLFGKSSIWSSLFTVVSTIFLGGGHWLITSCVCMPIFGMVMFAVQQRGLERTLSKFAEYFAKFQAGLTPPFVLAWCSPGLEDRMLERQEFWELFGTSMVGLFLFTAGSAVLWFAVLVPRFRLIARRNELEY